MANYPSPIGMSPLTLQARLARHSALIQPTEVKLEAKTATLTQERALEVFSYSPETGELRRKIKTGKCLAGSLVDSKTKLGGKIEYYRVGVDGKNYLAHLIIWLIQTGSFPGKGQLVDHKNQNGLDNRWDNLRLSNQTLNQHNQSNASINSKLGVLGVIRHPKGGYGASITVQSKHINLGRYATPEEAKLAYSIAKDHFFPGLIQNVQL